MINHTKPPIITKEEYAFLLLIIAGFLYYLYGSNTETYQTRAKHIQQVYKEIGRPNGIKKEDINYTGENQYVDRYQIGGYFSLPVSPIIEQHVLKYYTQKFNQIGWKKLNRVIKESYGVKHVWCSNKHPYVFARLYLPNDKTKTLYRFGFTTGWYAGIQRGGIEDGSQCHGPNK